MEKQIQEGIHNNPNDLITNLKNVTLSNNEIEIWTQTWFSNTCKRIRNDIHNGRYLWANSIQESYISQERLKTTLKAFTFNYLDIDDKQYIHDSKSLKVLQELCEKIAIRKTDKGQAIALVNHGEYVNSMQRMFDGACKFKKILPLHVWQLYKTIWRHICKSGETAESKRKQCNPNLQITQAHGLPKTHKTFEHLPKFRPIIDTTNTPYYGISKFLSETLNPLTENQYVAKDSFLAANKIREIPKELFDHGYQFVSFDVESLFTWEPLCKTINIILDQIYK